MESTWVFEIALKIWLESLKSDCLHKVIIQILFKDKNTAIKFDSAFSGLGQKDCKDVKDRQTDVFS